MPAHFCHVCTQESTRLQKVGVDYRCSHCGQEGFVEEISDDDDPRMFDIPIAHCLVPLSTLESLVQHVLSQAQRGFLYPSQIEGMPGMGAMPPFAQPRQQRGPTPTVVRQDSTRSPAQAVFIRTSDNGGPTMSSHNVSIRISSNGADPGLAAVLETMSRLSQEMHPILLQNQGGTLDRIIQMLMESDPNQPHGPPPASHAVVSRLPKRQLTKQDGVEQQCAICQEDYKEGEEVTYLTDAAEICNHFFHANCIIPWLREHNTCPVCRFELPTDDPEYERRRQQLREGIHRSISQDAEVAARTQPAGGGSARPPPVETQPAGERAEQNRDGAGTSTRATSGGGRAGFSSFFDLMSRFFD